MSKNQISPKLDIYALGLIILQLCCQMPKVLEVHVVLGNRDSKQTPEETPRLFAGKLAPMENTDEEAIARDLLCLGLECCDREPRNRPGLEQVSKRIEKLENQVCNHVFC